MNRKILHICIWLLVFSLGLALLGCTWEKPGDDASLSQPTASPSPVLSAGERAAARLQQSESGLMADGLRMPLPPPPMTGE